MAAIFVSYPHQVLSAARKVVEGLRSEGHAVWWDRDIRSPSHDVDISSELDRCDVVLVLFCHAALKSDWVKGEAETGRLKGKLLLARVDDIAVIDLPIPLRSGFDVIDLSPISRGALDIDKEADLFRRLARRCAGAPSAVIDSPDTAAWNVAAGPSPGAFAQGPQESRIVSVYNIESLNVSGGFVVIGTNNGKG